MRGPWHRADMTSRIRHARPVLAAAVLGPALLVGAAAASSADTLVHRDPAHDVVVTSYDRASGFQRRIDAGQRDPDLTLVRVEKSARQLAITTNLLEFTGVDSRWSAVVVTSKGDRFDFQRSVSTGAETPGPAIVVLRNGHRFSCDGLLVTRTRAGMIVRAPSACLADAWRVRVGVKVSATYREDGVGDQYGDDDAFRVGGGDDRRPVTLSSWVAR